jgi:peptidoglycan/LPS O-acetylase OafA/YrhL
MDRGRVAMSGQSGTMRFYILDPLRLLAAFAVLLYHYSIYFEASDTLLIAISRYGYLGVDFFFLLSGFVIMASAQHRSAFEFAFARGLRIYPAFIVCLLLTVLIVYWTSGTSIPTKNVFANATIFNDYLRIPNVDGVYWTLQAELKFYFCIFVLLLTGLFTYHRYWMGIWLFTATVHYFFGQPFFMGWLINPSYSFYFIAGISAYLLSRNRRDLNAQFCFWISTLFCILISGEQAKDFLSNPSSTTVFNVRIIITVFCLFFFALSLGYFNIKRVPAWWVYVGAVSYPLYLLHNRAGKSVIDKFMGVTNTYWLLLIVTLTLVLVALLIHRYVEKGADRLGKPSIKKLTAARQR